MASKRTERRVVTVEGTNGDDTVVPLARQTGTLHWSGNTGSGFGMPGNNVPVSVELGEELLNSAHGMIDENRLAVRNRQLESCHLESPNLRALRGERERLKPS